VYTKLKNSVYLVQVIADFYTINRLILDNYVMSNAIRLCVRFAITHMYVHTRTKTHFSRVTTICPISSFP